MSNETSDQKTYQEKLEWMLKDLAAPMEVLSAQLANMQLKQDELLLGTDFALSFNVKHPCRLTQVLRIQKKGEGRPTTKTLQSPAAGKGS